MKAIPPAIGGRKSRMAWWSMARATITRPGSETSGMAGLAPGVLAGRPCWTPWDDWCFDYGFGWGCGFGRFAWSRCHPPRPWWGPNRDCRDEGGVMAWRRSDTANTAGNIYARQGPRDGAGMRQWSRADTAAYYARAYNSRTGAMAAGQRASVPNVYGSLLARERTVGLGQPCLAIPCLGSERQQRARISRAGLTLAARLPVVGAAPLIKEAIRTHMPVAASSMAAGDMAVGVTAAAAVAAGRRWRRRRPPVKLGRPLILRSRL